ncbi:MAG TPA: cupin domain-containing protein [Burkholderiales bacterium]|nr:cupin domain-containing protein [Burkholderiales bacterium]
MAGGLKPLRRVVTGTDENGKSKIAWDGPAPNAHETSMGSGRGHTDLWAWDSAAASLARKSDDGNAPYDFPGPPGGGHLRVVQARGRLADYDAAKDPDLVPSHPPKERALPRTWDRGGNNAYSSAMHKTETIDYAVQVDGVRILVLDDAQVTLQQGDVVVQVGAWHQWTSAEQGGRMCFDMFAAHFVDGAMDVVQGKDPVMRADPAKPLPPGVKPARRVVTVDREPGKGSLVSDGPSPDVRTDPARPGFALARMWVTDSTPAKIVYETLQLPYVMQPPKHGSVFNVYTFPPDESWKGKVGAVEVQAFYRAMGAPDASTYSAGAPHPYMQKMRTLDFCTVTAGEIVLVTDTQEVTLKAGDIVIQRGTNHAWSNRSGRPAVVAIASHDATA